MLPGRLVYRQSFYAKPYNLSKSPASILAAFLVFMVFGSFIAHSPRLASVSKYLSESYITRNARISFAKQFSNPSIVFDPAALRHHEFPKKVWQWWKNGTEIPEGDLAQGVEQWRHQNPGFRYERLSNGDDETYVRDRTGWNPKIAQMFSEISGDTILRSDFVRYIALLMDGGVYADIDTTPQKSIEKWIPADVVNDTNLVVGIEMDKGHQEYDEIPYTVVFAQYAIMAKKGHPALLRVVEKVLRNLSELMDQKLKELEEARVEEEDGVKGSEDDTHHGRKKHKSGAGGHAMLGLSFHDVIKGTGPTAFSTSIWEYLSEQLGENFTGREITNITAPILMADVLVLPINGFGSGQLHSNSGSCSDPQALVCHLWRSSWVQDYPFDPNQDDEESSDDENQQENEDSS